MVVGLKEVRKWGSQAVDKGTQGWDHQGAGSFHC